MYLQQDWLPPAVLTAAAAEYGTPAYVYSAERIADNYRRLAGAFERAGSPVEMHYAVKANSNLAILRLLRACGAGFDVVSGGEMLAALQAGADAEQIVFAGVVDHGDDYSHDGGQGGTGRGGIGRMRRAESRHGMVSCHTNARGTVRS